MGDLHRQDGIFGMDRSTSFKVMIRPSRSPASWTAARSKARRIAAAFCKAIGTTREEIDMARNRLTGVAALGATLLVFITARTAQTTAASPTFTKDVAPILYKHCASCHRPGDIAPMSLLTYEQARPWAKAIREQVASGQMPPWHAAESHGTFSNDRRLSEQEKATLIAWVGSGAPKGEAKDLPPTPKFTDGWEIGTPDAVISMPKPYAVPAEGTIDYQYFQAPTNFTEDKWVQAIEARPGARSVVHHILVFCREPGGAMPQSAAYKQVVPQLSADAPAQAPAQATDTRRQMPGVLIASTTPGTPRSTLFPYTALRIK